VRARIK